MEAQGMQQPSLMPDNGYYQAHACKLDIGCAPWVCNQNTMCDHWNTAVKKEMNPILLEQEPKKPEKGQSNK